MRGIFDFRFLIFDWRAAALLLCSVLAPGRAVQAQDAVAPATISAIDRGLDYLAKMQLANGTFPSANPTAITGLSVMAFLSRGHVPGQGPYGSLVNRGIDAVLARQQPDGLFSPGSENVVMYDHGIATVMLCEACGMVDLPRRRKFDSAIAKAIKLIIAAQRVPKDPNDQGGWRYQPSMASSDISVTGWQLMALRGAANIGAAVPQQTIKDGLAYIRRRATPSGGFTYSNGEDPNEARTATGILSLELLGRHESPEALAGGDYLLRAAQSRAIQHQSYAIYYCAQAANQLGGKYWDGIYKPLRQAVLAHQQADGSWPVVGNDDQQGGPTYATAMAILALTVPLHYLPLYQR